MYHFWFFNLQEPIKLGVFRITLPKIKNRKSPQALQITSILPFNKLISTMIKTLTNLFHMLIWNSITMNSKIFLALNFLEKNLKKIRIIWKWPSINFTKSLKVTKKKWRKNMKPISNLARISKKVLMTCLYGSRTMIRETISHHKSLHKKSKNICWKSAFNPKTKKLKKLLN